jgi:hypothetical protein
MMKLADLLYPLIGLGFAAALQPLQIIAMLALLQTKHGSRNGFAYLGGMTAFRLSLAMIFWWLISGIEGIVEAEGGDFRTLTGIMMGILGLLLLVYALRQAFSAQSEDQAAASWLRKLDSVTPGKAALVGVGFLALDPKDWLIDIAAIDLIATADLSALQSGWAYLIYIIVAQGFLLIPLMMTLVFPDQSQTALQKLNTWLMQYERPIEISVALIFGVLFLYVGFDYLDIR